MIQNREREEDSEAGKASVELPEVAVRFVENQGSAETSRVYRSDLRDLIRFVSGRGRELLDTAVDDAVAWVRSLQERRVRNKIGLDPITVYRKTSVARTFFQTQKDAGRIGANPFAAVKTPDVDKRQGRTPYHSKREVELLIGSIDPALPRGLRDRAIALLLFANGLRVSEVAGLRRSQIGEEDGYAVIRVAGKGGQETKTTLRPEVRQVLEEHLAKNAAHGEYVFRASPHNARWFAGRDLDLRTRPIGTLSIWKMLKRAARAAGLDPRQIRPHCGRVFFITEAYKETRDLERVSRGVGHVEYDSTRGYLRYLDGAGMHAALAVKLAPKAPSSAGLKAKGRS